MGLETQSSNVSAPCRVAKNSDMLTGENVVCGQGLSAEGHLITPDGLPGCKRSHRDTRWEWMFYTGGYKLSQSVENSRILSQNFFRWF